MQAATVLLITERVLAAIKDPKKLHNSVIPELPPTPRLLKKYAPCNVHFAGEYPNAELFSQPDAAPLLSRIAKTDHFVAAFWRRIDFVPGAASTMPRASDSDRSSPVRQHEALHAPSKPRSPTMRAWASRCSGS